VADRVGLGSSSAAARHDDHRVTRSTRLVKRQHPADPDVLVTTTIESWNEATGPGPAGVPAGRGPGATTPPPLPDAPPLGQRRIWRHLEDLAAHLAGSSSSMRALAGPALARIVQAAADARFELDDAGARMIAPGITVVAQDLTARTVLIRIFEQGLDRRRPPRETQVRFTAANGIVSVRTADGVELVEVRRGAGRANLERRRTTRATTS
jgi:hypothetical protein